ncbi:argininosuccinate synthase [Candidatus Peregrinibacteria bacterium CG22_combo_CG10-13_8_21_14_all_44_10]|nr:MAG: argininosuccinate synthase [Candidatus Peregrinibacteria bacterium CG2_30_44_17]PIP66564.1 MAG: argininosuccinate synthase [Candidatus Peregrinibacteria bacterium CG22_combo_CG10-13_8_21_14_all_44_10]PIS04094.1 MAG: argininosuccinate synthase [Candidatus Peregrinibacteria bacterium CG10_big_fil_rev_8_21_14_0_10_44_7]PIX79734.1 MAG: argininosuccinate synthase [Candidatus Peregrinibacteria bacterium CG_4_10_14_3_um_filter_44_21]PJB89002.1 MAG: argininosuccinate synthase [Candidatus Peregr
MYKKIASHEASKAEANSVLLLYSGGLDTSVMLKWIKDEYEADVTTLTVNIGQIADFDEIKKKAENLHVKEAIVVDATEDFAKNYITKAIKANASYQGNYHLFCPIGRAIISKIAVQIAQEKNIKVIAHGCTGKGNDQVRFESYITTLDPTLKTIAPVREWGMGRDEELAYAKKHGIPVPHTVDKPYSYDDNLWGCSAEGGEIEEIDQTPILENILKVCKTPTSAPDMPQTIKISFKQGIPTAINGETMELQSLIATLNKLGAEHGVGITHLIEDRMIGLKVRGVYEEPAAAILIEAHKNLEKLVSTKDENDFKQIIDQKWADLCYCAKWYEPLMQNLHAFIDQMSSKVTGEVKVKLYKGTVTVISASSPYSMFNKDMATFMKNDLFNQNASAGFIELYSLAQRTAYNVGKKAQADMLKPDYRF